MPAKSKQQQKFFGVVKAMQKGDIPKKGEAGDVADDMSKKDVDKYAGTKHKGLPKKVKKEMISKNRLKEIIREELKNVLIENTGYTVVYRDRALDKTYTAEIPSGISKTEIKQMLKKVVPVGLEIIGIEPLKESDNEGIELVHVYKNGKMFGTGELVKGKKQGNKVLVRYDAEQSEYVPEKDVKLVESVNESEEIQVTEPIWKKMSDEERIEALYSVVQDPDEAQRYFELDWNELPPGFERDMVSPPLGTETPDVKDLSMISRGRAKAALKQIKTGKRSDGMPGPFTARLFGVSPFGTVHQITDEDALNLYNKFGLAEKKL